MQDHVAWAHIKQPKRVLQKLQRVYDGKVSRVLDLCRELIVFDSVAELLACVNAVMADDQVVVERIKNRLCDAHDVMATAGYR